MDFLGKGGRGRKSSNSEQLAGGMPKEPWIVYEVTPPKAARFNGQAEEPFQAGFLEKLRGLGNRSGMEIERRSDSHHDRRNDPTVSSHPFFLLGATEAHKEDLDSALVNVLNQGLVFRGAQGAKGWAQSESDVQFWELVEEVISKLGGGFFLSSEKADR